MSKWVIYAFASMICAGFTAVIAKFGLKNISSDLGMAIRTLFVLIIVVGIATVTVPMSELKSISLQNIGWLAVSAIATGLSWLFYYRAIQEGEVSTVALIDKGSVLIALVLSAILLNEAITLPKIAGALMIFGGLIVIALG
jgi:transporter family protein